MGDGSNDWRRTRRDCLSRGGALLAAGLLAGCPDRDGAGGTSTPPGERESPIPYDVSVDHDPTAWDRYDPDWDAPTDAPPTDGYTVETVVENLEIPWDLDFLPSGELFATERTGRILSLEAGELRTVAEPGSIIDAEALDPGTEEQSWVVEGGEGGLLGVAAHPTYPDPPIVYAYFTAETDAGLENRVVAFDASADDPSSRAWPIVEGIPAHTFHNGGRIAFGPANYLWIATGDGDPALDDPDGIRDPGTLAGKILRVNPDGSAPADNPDVGPDADPRVYTYGHRNPQGFSWLPDGTPVITEHGPGGGDEVNVLEPGADYGWPHVRNDSQFEPYTAHAANPPVADAGNWAPAGSVFYTGSAVPGLENRLVFGGLISQQVVALTLVEDGTPAEGHDRRHDEPWMDESYGAASSALLAEELGRVRHVEQGPDGALYAITSNRDGRAEDPFPTERDDRLVRIGRGDG